MKLFAVILSLVLSLSWIGDAFARGGGRGGGRSHHSYSSGSHKQTVHRSSTKKTKPLAVKKASRKGNGLLKALAPTSDAKPTRTAGQRSTPPRGSPSQQQCQQQVGQEPSPANLPDALKCPPFVQGGQGIQGAQ